jgi:uncharacterized protein
MEAKIVHLEIPAGDTARAIAFWSGLFGLEFESFPGSPVEYHTARFSDTSGGAIHPAEGDERGTRPYFGVDDIRAGVARVAELGGEAGEPTPVPGMGWFATCTDVEGNAFGLWQSDPDAAMPDA